ncbi:hypothetical protein [Paraliobacillus sediminis]|uniref:hypothetical protein n=1 Tax=Paraliobacillus sediminis TaxID=1885916 RepID=UPI000E3B671C|nr:hypothetical protein [Paraliobacillus sediminis]
MHWRKLALLLPPFILSFYLLITYLPETLSQYSIAVAILFWIIYYGWVFIEEKQKEKLNKDSTDNIK